jgi:glycosyltransferase involved in cell wall biosynthesis
VRSIETYAPMPPISAPSLLPRTGPAAPGGRQPPIVLVNAALATGGAERQLVNLMQGLAARGCRATLLTLHLDERSDLRFFLSKLAAAGLEVRNAMPPAAAAAYLVASCGALPFKAFRGGLRWPPADIRDDIVRLAAELHAIGPRVVHGWQDATGIVAAFAGLALGLPRIVISGRNLHPEHFSHARPYMRKAYAYLAGRPEVVLTNNSRAGARSYADWLGLEPSAIRVIRNGLDTGAFSRPTADEITAFRLSIGLRPAGLLVGGIFRLQAEKRPLLWLEVAARVSLKVPDARFVVFGSGTMRRQLEKAAARLSIADRLVMLGTELNVRLALAMLDVLVLTSSLEGTPNVVLEAACLGVPVVATDAGGTSEAMIDGHTGLLVREQAVSKISLADALSNAVAQVLAGAISKEKVGDVGRAFIQAAFGLDRMIDQTRALYDANEASASCAPHGLT